MFTAHSLKPAVAVLLATGSFLAGNPPEHAGPVSRASLAFEENRGQAGGGSYLARADGYDVLLDPTGFTIVLPDGRLRFLYVGARADAVLTGVSQLPGKISYLNGRDPASWKPNIPAYAAVEGAGVTYRGERRHLGVELTDPELALRIEGFDERRIDAATGDLVVTAGRSQIRLERPGLAIFALQGADEVRILPPKGAPDAQLLFTTRVIVSGAIRNGSPSEVVRVATDSAGNAYVTGRVATSPATSASAFVTKLAADGATRLYTAYFDDVPLGIAVNTEGEAIVTGRSGASAFASKLAADGASWVYAITLGEDAEGCAVDVDADGTAWVAGERAGDAFVSRIDADGAVVASVTLGGRGDDLANAIRVDGHGGAVVAGSTSSSDFPVRRAFQPTLGGARDAFVAHVDASGTVALSTYFGGAGEDAATGLGIDGRGVIHVSGSSPSAGGGRFVAEISEDGEVLRRVTRRDGPVDDAGSGFAVDASGQEWFAAGAAPLRAGTRVTDIALRRAGGPVVAGITTDPATTLTLESSPAGGDAFATFGAPEAPAAAGCPGTIHFTGGGGTGLWQTAANWDLNRLPNATDDACIPSTFAVTLSSGTQTVNTLFVDAASSLSISAGSLSVAAASQVNGSFTLSGSGTVTGAGDFTTAGTFSWSGGTLTGAGNVIANGGVQLSGAATKDITASRLLTTNGPNTTWTGAGSIRVGTGGALTNNGTWDCQSDASFQTLGTPGPFTNAGAAVFKKTAGAGSTTMGIAFNNAGTATVQSGTLNISSGGTGTGSFTGAGTLQFSGAYTLAAASSVNASGVSFTAGTVGISGTYAATATTISGGTMSFDGASPASTGTLTFSGGTLQGTGTVNVSGLTTWSGGTMTGAGTTNTNGGMTVGGASAHDLTGSRILNTAGTTTWSGTGSVRVGTSGTITNNGTWDCQTNSTLQTLGTPGPFTNPSGSTFQKSVATGVTSIGIPFNSGGTVTVLAGTLGLNGGGSGTGSFSGSAGTTLSFGGGTYTLGTASSISADTVQFSAGTVNIDGTYAAVAGTTINGGTANFDPTATLTAIGSALAVSSGTATFTSGEAVAPATLSLTGGTLGGTDTVNVSGATTWSAGTMTGAATTNTNGGMTISGAGAKDLTSSRILNAGGTTAWTGSGSIRVGAASSIVNRSGATWDCQSDATIQNLGSAVAFRNAPLSTFKKSGGAGTTNISIPFNVERDGTGPASVLLQSGTLSLTAGGTGSGVLTGSAGTTFQFASAYLLDAASSLSGDFATFTTGTSTVDGGYSMTGGSSFTGGTVNFDPSSTLSNVGAQLSISGGIVNFNSGETIASTTLALSSGTLGGTDTVNVSGATTWNGGTMTGAGTTNTNGGMTISVNGVHDLTASRVLNASGTTTVVSTAGTIRVGSAATIVNKGLWDSQGDSGFQNLSLAGPFTNQPLATFRKSGGTSTTFGIPFNVQRNGSGPAVVDLQIGTLNLAFGGTGSGSFTGAAGTTFQFSSQTYGLDSASTFSADSVLVSGGAVNFGGTYAAVSGTTLNQGTATWDPSCTLTSIGSALAFTGGTGTFTSGETVSPATLNFTQGTLGGTDNVSISGASTWTAGLMTGAGTVSTNGGLTLSGNGSRDLTANRVLTTAGTTTWTGGALRLGSGASITNNGVWDCQNDNTFQNLTGAGPFNNAAGTFKKSAGAGLLTFNTAFNNAAAVEAQSGTLQFVAGYTQTNGSTKLNGGAITSSTAMDIQAGTFTGAGTVTGSVTSTSAHAVPGLPVGALTVSGNYAQTATGHLDVDIGGLTPVTQHDQLNLTGTGAATLAGTLNVALVNGFIPSGGDTFTIMNFTSRTGTFATLNAPALPVGCWLPVYNPTSVVLQVWTSAQEITGVVIAADKTTISWLPLPPQPGPTPTYDVMRGNLLQFPVGGKPGEICLDSGTSATSSSDATTPGAGTGFYYLVRGKNLCGTGTYGTTHAGAPRNVTVCP